MESETRQAAVAAGETLIELLRRHVDAVAGGAEEIDETLDAQLWDAVGEYGDLLDELYGDEDDDEGESDESTGELGFTVRARYDFVVVDEKEFLAAGKGIGGAVYDLIHEGGRVFPALDVPSLEAGSGILTVHVNDEPLTPADFDEVDNSTDLLLIDPKETESFVLAEPVYGSRAEAEAAAKKLAD